MTHRLGVGRGMLAGIRVAVVAAVVCVVGAGGSAYAVTRSLTSVPAANIGLSGDATPRRSLSYDPLRFSLDATAPIRRLAGIVTGTITIGGDPTTVTMASGDDANITFDGSNGQHLGLALSGVTIGTSSCCSAIVSVLKPSGGTVATPSAFGTDGKTLNYDLPENGTYTIVIDPQGTAAGSVTLTLSEDVTNTITVGGPTSTLTTSRIGQNGRVTFSGNEGQHLGLALSNVTLGASACCSGIVSVLKPDGTLLTFGRSFGTNGGTLNIPALPSTATYTIFVDPQEVSATGSVTLTLSEDLASSVTVGGAATTVNLARLGQNGRVTFSGTQGQQLKLTLSNVTLGTSSCCSGLVSVLNPPPPPDPSTLMNPTAFGTAGKTITLPTLTQTGTHTIFLDPYQDDLSTGSVTVKLTTGKPLAQSFGVCGGAGINALDTTVCTADPVNSLTGAFTTSQTDFTLASKGLPFTLTRSYTSADPTTGRLGTGWTDNYAVSLAIQPNGDAILHGDEGQQVYYTKQPDGSFVGAAGALSTLSSISGGYKLTRHDQVAYTFSSAGVLQSEVDRNGQSLSFSYDGSGRLATATDASGHTITFSYSGSGTLLSSVGSTAQNTVSYGYTGGQLTSVTLPDPDGPGPLAQPVTHYTYDAGGRLATIVDPNNQTQVTNVYDTSSGRVTQQTDANNKTTNFAWDAATQTATATDANNHAWKDVYANNVLIKRIDATNKQTVFDHNSSLDTTAVTSPDGSSTTSMTYDSAGNLLTATAPPSLGSVQKVFNYDAQNNVKTIADARGKQTAYGYDTAGNLTSITLDSQPVASTTYNAQGQMLTSTDGNGKTTTYTYNANGQIASMTAPDPDGAGPLEAAKTTYTYDTMGNVLTKVAPLGNCTGCNATNYTTTFTYDAEGHVLTETDPLGNVTKHTYDLAGNETGVEDANHHITTYEYDNANHLTKITEPDPDGAGPLTAPITTYSYDDVGNRITEVSPRGNVPGGNPAAYTTAYTYDSNNRLASVTTPKAEKTTFTYDANGNRDSIVEPRGNVQGANPNDYKTTYTYDAAGRLRTSQDPLGNITTAHYDAGGNLDWIKDANLHQASFTYDAAGRVLTVTAPDGGLTTYTYDGNGNLKTRKDDNNHTTTYIYDDAGRLMQLTGPDPDGAGPGTAPLTTYTYDVNGNALTTIDPNGNATQTAGDGKTTYTYDRNNRVKTIAYSDTTSGVTFNYNAVGNRSSTVDGSGTLAYGYDALDRLTSVTRGTNTFSYTYDPAGNVLTRTYPDATQITYTYDEDNRLASVASGGNTTSYGYDDASNLIRTTLPLANGYVETRSYDRAGRLTEVKNATNTSPPNTLSDYVSTLDPVGNPTSIQDGTNFTTYTYDANDRLTGACFLNGTCPNANDPFIRWTYDKVGNRKTEARPGAALTNYTYNGLDQLTAAGSTNYTYDQNGNEKSAGTRTFTYDLANRLKTTASGSTTTTYTYDGDGARLQASTGSQASKKTNYLWDTNRDLAQLALERDGNNALIRRYIYGQRRVSMRSGSSDYYYHYDPLGSARNVTSSSGVTQWTDVYEPFGAIRSETSANGAPANLMKFAGEYLDPTNLYHLRARQYDPVTGRFTRVDPLPDKANSIAISPYLYVADRPTLMIDPSGMILIPATDGQDASSGVFSWSSLDPDKVGPPGYTPPCGARPNYPLGKIGLLIGRPGQGTHAWNSQHTNWQDANAIDIRVPIGTRVCALFRGRIGDRIGALPNAQHDPHLLGLRVYVEGAHNQVYYAHLSRIIMNARDPVVKDQVIGYSGSAVGVPHLHLALRYGNPTVYAP